MKKTLLYGALICASLLNAQNTIDTANAVDGTENFNVTTDFGDISYSGLTPSCVTTKRDLFYSHDVSVGDNKLTIALNVDAGSGNPNATVDIQILKAIGGNIATVEQVDCSSFVVDATGGSFSYIIENVLPTDDYYLRIYVPNISIISELDNLVNNTTVTMSSEFDATLSQSDLTENSFGYTVKMNSIDISNAQKFKDIYIFDISGKKVMNVTNDLSRRSIDISGLRNGVYIMNLIGNETENKSLKFIKR